MKQFRYQKITVAGNENPKIVLHISSFKDDGDRFTQNQHQNDHRQMHLPAETHNFFLFFENSSLQIAQKRSATFPSSLAYQLYLRIL